MRFFSPKKLRQSKIVITEIIIINFYEMYNKTNYTTTKTQKQIQVK